jgi:hypothetical protein
MRRKQLLLTWVHFALAIFSMAAALESLLKSMGLAMWFPLPQYIALLPVSISMLIRAINEFNEAEKGYVELRNS